MSMDWNDPRLTAYALGELEGAELREMEALVRENKEAREYVRQVRETANTLSSELKSEPIPHSGKPQGEPARPWWKLTVLNPYFTAVAAGLAALVILLPSMRDKISQSRSQRMDEPVADIGEFKPEPAPKLEMAEKKKAIEAPKEIAQAQPAAPAPREESRVAMQDQLDAEIAPAKAMKDTGAAGSLARMAPSASTGYGIAARAKGAPGVTANSFVPEGESDGRGHNTESYAHINESDFVRVGDQPLSTFSIDVDTASYSVMRRFLNSGALPPPDAVRIEEMINYFPYAYAPPKDDKPFAVHVEQIQAPWKTEHKLVRIGLKSKDIDLNKRPKSNIVFLLDVSGSMNDENKLPLLKTSLRQMIEKFNDNDRVAIVVYAGASGLVLPATSNKNEILAALEKLESGGSTNGGEGIQLAYKIAQSNFIPGGTNRVILATDGDFNVGTTSEGDLIRLIEEKAKSKIFLTVLGFGSGNYKDSMMEKLADKGNGNYAYIDTLAEAKKALVEQMGGTLVTVAKDVKIQVEFNPKFASAYRLIGYENRKLNKEDFNDDTKDAGEIGAGHTVTALYEIVPAGVEMPLPAVDALKYAKTEKPAADVAKADAGDSKELLTVKLRYKQPEGDKSRLIEVPVINEDRKVDQGSADLKFTAAVAEFGMILRDSKWKGKSSYPDVLKLARQGQKNDEYRKEFIQLVEKARKLKTR